MSDQRERATPQRTVMFGLLFLLLLIAAMILGYVFLGKPPAPTPEPTEAVQLPAAPSDLTADVVAVFDVPVGWQDNSDNEDGFNIYRQRIDLLSTKDKAGSSDKDTISFLDGGTVCGATYQYTVASYNAAGESPAVPCWQVTLPSCPVPGNFTLKVGDRTISPDVYLSDDGTSLMSDQDGQNGVIDLGDVGGIPLDQVSLPHPQNWVKDGVPVVAGHTYAVLMPGGESVHVLTVKSVDSAQADAEGIIWNPGSMIAGACDTVAQTPGGPCINGDKVCDLTCTGGPDRDCPQTTVTATITPTSETATPCAPSANTDCTTPTVTETSTPECFCQGTSWVCTGEQPIPDDRRCTRPTDPPTETEPPPGTCPPNSTDPACGGQVNCYCEVSGATGAWDGNYVCSNEQGVVVSTVVDFAKCPAPVCGNGSVEGIEECDGNTCPGGGACNADCTCPVACVCVQDSPTSPYGHWQGNCPKAGQRCQVQIP